MIGRVPLLFCFGCLLLLAACHQAGTQASGSSSSDPVNALWRADLQSMDSVLGVMEASGHSGALDSNTARKLFKTARLAYKRQEFLWEYGFPALAARLNGAADDAGEAPVGEGPGDAEHEGKVSAAPTGLQVLEDKLYARPPAPAGEILDMLGSMRSLLTDTLAAAGAWSDSSLLDAARLELFRLAFLGTTSFDSPAARQSLPETQASLEGMIEALQVRFRGAPRGHEALARLSSLARAAALDLAAHSDFTSFDRGAFLTARMQPLYGALGDLQAALSVPLPKDPRAYPPAARTLFSASAWDASFFAPADARGASADRIDLGHRLFFDPILSGNGTRSCAVCHAPEHAFTDGLTKNVSIRGRGTVARNTPTLIDVAFQQGAFADLRANSLEQQAGMVIQNPDEMGGDLDTAAVRLNADPEYSRRFLQAFAADSSSDRKALPATPDRIKRVMAAYVRTLIAFDSPWDRFVRGDSGALTPEARRGFNVFMGKAECATCHFPPLFNGTRPPLFAETEMEVIGTPGRVTYGIPKRAFPDGDSGRMVQDHSARDFRAFKTPTLRNVEYTAPYMHNGVFATLEQVVDFYDAGGGAGMGLDVPNQTLPRDSLHLDPGEKRELVAFLKALSDTAGTTARPHPVPGRYVLGR